MCVVLSVIDREASEIYLIDKAAILCSLNIKAMAFDDDDFELEWKNSQFMPSKMSVTGNFIEFNRRHPVRKFEIPLITEISNFLVQLKLEISSKSKKWRFF
jgi:hypothetical protein